MDGSVIKRIPVFNYSYNLPILSATIPPDWNKTFCLEYCNPVNYDSGASVIIVASAGYDIAHALEIARRFKSRGKTVIAGANMDALSDRLLGECCDAVFQGYPDPPMMRRMLTDAAAARLERTYRPERQNMDYPLDYEVLEGMPLSFLPVLASLGCKNSCTYCCYPPAYHGRYHLRPLERVLADFAAASAFGKPIAFLDANLYNNRAFLLRLARAIAAQGTKTTWGAQCTADIGDDPEVLEAIYRAGCRLLVFGLESLQHENMVQLNKPYRVEGYSRQLKAIKRAGIQIVAFFMVGMDGDNHSTFGEIDEFIKNNPIAVPYLHLLFPVPGTALYDKLKTEGRLASELFDEYSRLDPRYSVPCSSAFFRPKGLTAQELEEGYFRLAKRVSTIPRILRRSMVSDPRLAAGIWSMNMEGRRFVAGMTERRRHRLAGEPT
jgi:radical SAM superfamily enzyme YgiQ (UPF0313 family)